MSRLANEQTKLQTFPKEESTQNSQSRESEVKLDLCSNLVTWQQDR